MWYLFNNQNQCYANCSGEPNHKDLATRSERAIESDLTIPINEVVLVNGEVTRQELLPPTMAELKQQKLQKINSARTQAEHKPIIYMEKLFATDSDTLIRINIAAQSARNALSAGKEWTIAWTEGAIATTFTAVKFLGLLDAITDRNNRIFEISRELKELVEKATIKEELDIIQWPESIY